MANVWHGVANNMAKMWHGVANDMANVGHSVANWVRKMLADILYLVS